MRSYSLYALLSIKIFVASYLLLEVGAFEKANNLVQHLVVPLWEHPFSDMSLVLTDLGSISSAFIFFSILTVALIIEGYWKRALIIASIGLITALLTYIAKEIIAIPRPIEQLRAVSGFRFPSGHASASLAMALSFIYVIYGYFQSLWMRIPLVLIALSFAVVVGGTRIFMNVHRPLDIIAGFSIALFATSITFILARHLHVSE